ncbi:hypothetical protein SanaruYs_19920 [Chryseotalea sanaruensis]|uniref:Uncharacterized protein n=1 Tax=Chryseotalea sanaruensis TaxID=2482724 RepID=A0A401UA21_9BACT|nr:hypothetical protein [Chryseotalea sanaruensis]GCC51763.1 hypothetical protein SanaruYs_19920 [Chryseotalea sanaruensis]
MKNVDFKTSNYFSWHVHAMAAGLVIIALVVFAKSILGGFAILLVCAIIFTTHYRLKIDFEKKEYRDYLWIFGLKDGKKYSFDALAYFFIKTNRVSQTMGLKAANTTVVKEVYDAYLKFSDDEKLHVISSNTKAKILKKLIPVAENLNIKILDYTDGEAKVIS